MDARSFGRMPTIVVNYTGDFSVSTSGEDQKIGGRSATPSWKYFMRALVARAVFCIHMQAKELHCG
jgi:hypothetical protein